MNKNRLISIAVCVSYINNISFGCRKSLNAFILIYDLFARFTKAFVDKGQVETKMLSALLSGVNRAFNYVQGTLQLLLNFFFTSS